MRMTLRGEILTRRDEAIQDDVSKDIKTTSLLLSSLSQARAGAGREVRWRRLQEKRGEVCRLRGEEVVVGVNL